MSVGSRDVTGEFGRAGDGTTEGLVDGLALGENVLTATVAGGRGAHLTVTNHPTYCVVVAAQRQHGSIVAELWLSADCPC